MSLNFHDERPAQEGPDQDEDPQHQYIFHVAFQGDRFDDVCRDEQFQSQKQRLAELYRYRS